MTFDTRYADLTHEEAQELAARDEEDEAARRVETFRRHGAALKSELGGRAYVLLAVEAVSAPIVDAGEARRYGDELNRGGRA